MAPRCRWPLRLGAAAALGLLAGCFDEPPVVTGLVVFDDAFHEGFTPNPFEYSLTTALSVDETRAHGGSASIRLDVPALPGYTGGAVLAAEPQDFSGTNALVFWIQGSREATLDEIGFGLDFDPDPSPYRSAVFDLAVTTEWARHVVPIADPAKVTADKGMLYYVDTDETAYSLWLDDVKLDRVDTAALDLEPSMATVTATLAVGGSAPVPGLALRYTDADGAVRDLDSTAKGSGPAPAFFRFTSSNPSVATVDTDGQVTAVAAGEAVITARLAGEDMPGAFTVDVVDALPTEPAAAPPAPTAAAADVISLFSQAYTNVAVDTWCASWSAASCSEVVVAGEPLERYSALDFVGVEFKGANLIDATGMSYFHADVWTPDATTVRVKLVDFGADGDVGGGDDSEQELAFTAASSPPLAASTWVSLDLPLSSFTGLTGRAHLGQLIFSALPTAGATLYVDNVYFHR